MCVTVAFVDRRVYYSSIGKQMCVTVAFVDRRVYYSSIGRQMCVTVAFVDRRVYVTLSKKRKKYKNSLTGIISLL